MKCNAHKERELKQAHMEAEAHKKMDELLLALAHLTNQMIDMLNDDSQLA